ncbi:MAG: hypothetical protein KatS3mg096_900 [Candidatus Parcubacteria bacterium]|nr:MAG: hypothetical protein KatS3mg096_900 [Candidatus Parcubacteria bacterium]
MVEVVIKSNGRKEKYQKEKIIKSLQKLNLSQDKISEIIFKIDKELPQVISTKKLFQFIFSQLKEKETIYSYKYNLKQAIFKLGPAGYPFEKFIAHLLKLYDYQVRHNIFLQGACLGYEIDLLAEKDNIIYIGECKFHQHPRKKNDIKVVLYSYARFLDIMHNLRRATSQILNQSMDVARQYYPMVITNTRFTSEAIKYSECYNLKLLAWDYPQESLSYLIDNKKAYPLTIFDFLPLKILQNFFNYDIVLIQDVIEKEKSYLKKISGLNENEINNLFDIINNIL